MKVGLVLGAGGVLGASWLIGALDALEAETGWKARDAEHIVGTSAGSVIGALAASGIDAAYMTAYSSGASLDGYVEAEARAESVAERISGSEYELHWGLPPIGPGSWRLAISTILRPTRHAASVLLAGWLPRGFVSTRPIAGLVESFVPGSWPDHPGYWAVAADYATGRRVPFGREDAPPATVAEAVAASCAIPGFYRCVEIDGRPYVDGGVRSTSNLDVLRREPLDLVVALNPTSSLHAGAPRTIGERVAFELRQAAGRRLGSEAKRLRAAGIDVVLIQPTVHDLDAIGSNLMSSRRRHHVTETAVRTATEHLRNSPIGTRLAKLPAGDPRLVRRPAGQPSSWPDFRTAASERWVNPHAA